MAVDLIKQLEEAKDRYLNGDLSRRDFLKVLGSHPRFHNGR